MDYHGILMKGDLQTDNIKSRNGTLSVEIDDTTGKITLKTNLKIESGSPSNDYVLVSDSDGDCSFAPRSIPANSIILFEADTAITGYTLLTGVDDGVVYITKGSAAGGETGGSYKTGGTWSLASSHTHTITAETNHTHTTRSFTLTSSHIPSHWHYTAYENGYNNTGVVVLASTNYVKTGADYGDGRSYYFRGIDSVTPNVGRSGSTGSGNSHNHGSTYGDGGHDHGGATGGTSLGSSWRPYGRNYTRQRKS